MQVTTNLKDSVDILFYSCFGFKHYQWPQEIISIYYSGENNVPNFNECDYAMSFHRISFGNRHFRLFLCCISVNKNNQLERSKALNRGFCSSVVYNIETCDPRRIQIIDELNKYIKIASGGRYRYNVGGPVSDKIKFCGKYKFNLALENSCVDGYVTEKIVDAMVAHTVPIYWGATDAALDFNPNAFININDFGSLKEAIEYIEQVDRDDDLYLRILNAPKFKTVIPWQSQLLDFLSEIIETKRRYVCSYGWSGVLSKKQY